MMSPFDPPKPVFIHSDDVLPYLLNTHTILDSNPQNQQISCTLSLPSTISMTFDPPQPVFIDDNDHNNSDDDDYENDEDDNIPLPVISVSGVLMHPLAILYLFQCFQEAQDNVLCETLAKSFENGVIDIKDHHTR